jgi:hypothetical protein
MYNFYVMAINYYTIKIKKSHKVILKKQMKMHVQCVVSSQMGDENSRRSPLRIAEACGRWELRVECTRVAALPTSAMRLCEIHRSSQQHSTLIFRPTPVFAQL